MASLGLKNDVIALEVNRVLGQPNSCRRFKGHPEYNGLAIGDPPLDAAAEIGPGTQGMAF